MTKGQIKKFAVGYPYPTDYVEILLKKYNFDTEKVNDILCGSKEVVLAEIQNIMWLLDKWIISWSDWRKLIYVMV